jgi:hypothetical protein
VDKRQEFIALAEEWRSLMDVGQTPEEAAIEWDGMNPKSRDYALRSLKTQVTIARVAKRMI